jgi:nucleotide-binding universal stress UspA family protein
MTSKIAPVVVGYDGSHASVAALGWAAAEAVREGTALRIAEVFEVAVMSRPSPGKVVPSAALRTVRERGLEALAESIRLQNPKLDVQGVLLEGAPAAALIEETVDARMVVLGTRGLGGFAGLLLGSTSQHVLHHANCPVAIVR